MIASLEISRDLRVIYGDTENAKIFATMQTA